MELAARRGKGEPAPPLVVRRLPLGAEVQPGGRGVDFRVWAPACHTVEVVAFPEGHPFSSSPPASITVPLHAEPEGYFSGQCAQLKAGSLYGFRLDGADVLSADPASRFQPEGPEGLSRVVDLSQFPWSDGTWSGVPARGQVLYEMHLGTFTRTGNWAAAQELLPELVRTGITVVEVLPIADFPGEFGWGYDGVNHFAPTRLYGEPEDLCRFVDRAHALGLGVILDVVYNHFGPSGNPLPRFSPDYTTQTYANEWGDAVNFDGERSGPVREYFLANVRYWIEEYHLDGFRFDATQSIHDSSASHILTEMISTARAAAPQRALYLIAENEPQHVRMISPPEAGGHGMDALWNDDFHHSAVVCLTRHNEAYYSDYCGTASELLACALHGFLYQGQYSQWQKKPRGTPARDFPAHAFITFLQNHDQVANSETGERIHRLTSPDRLRALTGLWLLLPHTPLFFQGQEYGAPQPFYYFAHNEGELAALVAGGREDFLSQFPSLDTPAARQRLRSPSAHTTFSACQLDMTDRDPQNPWVALHADLLRLRREDPLFSRTTTENLTGAVLNAECLLLRYADHSGDDRLIIANFGRDFVMCPAPEPLLAPPCNRHWTALWDSNRREYGGRGMVSRETEGGWHIAGDSTAVFRAAPGTVPQASPGEENYDLRS